MSKTSLFLIRNLRKNKNSMRNSRLENVNQNSEDNNSKINFLRKSIEMLKFPEIPTYSNKLLSQPEYLVLDYWKDLLQRLKQQENLQRGIRISIEGNIASGKSTFLKYIQNQNWIQIQDEPLFKWTNLKGHNLLQLLYSDLHRWNYTFRAYVQLTFVERTFNENNKVQILERSLASNRFCFVEHAYQNGFLSQLEYETLLHWFEIFEPVAKTDFIVYFRCSPQKCYARVQKRNRPEEMNLPLKYFEELHLCHEKWLMNKKSTNILVIDCEDDDLEFKYKEIVGELLKIKLK